MRKNIYAVAVGALFAIALAMFILFIALFSSSTAVDGTTVGSVYIGDQKPNTEGRKKKLIDGVEAWKKDARYTISFQNYSFTIGRTDRLDDEGNPMYDDDGNQLFDDKGLYLLDFDYTTTNSKINNGESNNLAIFNMTPENEQILYDTLVETFGGEVTNLRYLDFTKLTNDIKKDAEQMNTKCDYDLYDYLNISWTDTLVSQVDIENLSVEKVNFLYEIFNEKEIVIAPQKSNEGKLGFSIVEFFSQEEFANVGLTSSDMSIIATGFAAVVQATSLTVTVKNQGYISDRYYAYDDMTARVNIKDGTDLRIINPESHEFVISIKKGEKIIDGKTSLKFLLNGCRLVNKYTITKNETAIENQIIYDDRQTDFDYDATNPNMGIDTEKGCYYYIYQEGKATYLYSYTKTITYVDGTKASTEVYPKQEFFVGQDEYREWTTKDYN